MNVIDNWKRFLGFALVWAGLLLSWAAADSVIVFNEIMYHPRADDGVEWVELYNQMGVDIDLSGWSLQGGVDYVFPAGTIVPSGAFVVVTSDLQQLWGRVAPGALVLGPFTGKLSNSGETLSLVNNSARVLNKIRYSDGGDWPVAADGSGVTLAKIHANRESDDPVNWTWSEQQGGTPGAANFSADQMPLRGICFNEMASVTADVFFLELAQVGNVDPNLDGLRIEVQGTIQASYDWPDGLSGLEDYPVVRAEDLGFVPVKGDRVFLWSGQGRLLDAVLADDVLRGRSPDGTGRWLYPVHPTAGAVNAFDLCSDIVINEIMYHPLTLPSVPPQRTTHVLVPEQTAARVLVPVDDSAGRRWTGIDASFSDADWISGTGGLTGVGYERSSGYESYLGTDVGDEMYGKSASVYVRIPFAVTDVTTFSALHLSMRYDDGFIAYLNGVEVARAQASANAAWNARATGSRNDSLVVLPQVFDISAFLPLLRAGDNLLALHGLNVSATSSDLLIQPVLSALESIDSQLSQSSDEDVQTWIELYNRGDVPVDLSDWRFTRGIDFSFAPGTLLQPDTYLVVAKDSQVLWERWPLATIVGDFSGNLAHNGERLLLVDALGNPVDELHYYDGGAWPAHADGGGCSLELIDVRADNKRAGAWDASNELGRSVWQDYAYRARAVKSPVGRDELYSEFVMGLLDQGEILIDDVQVIEDPDGTAQTLLQNSDFAQGTQAWRIIGNHSTSSVVPDPDDPGNPVLRLVATGPAEHMSNHAETTLAQGRRVQNGRTYEIRFRARWVAGTPLLNTRLFFNRVASTTVLAVPSLAGTPGRVNSRAQANIGPTFSDLTHVPAVPARQQDVTVTVRPDDPDGVDSMRLWYRADDAPWQSTAMASADGHLYDATIPGHGSGTLVQFFVQGSDRQGASVSYPAAGPESFAQYEVLGITAGRFGPVSAGQIPRDTGVHTYRIVMRRAQRERLYERGNRMSNERLGATLIVNEHDVYYNVGVRLKSSEHGRPKTNRIGFSLRFNPQHPFRGVHRALALDRSNGQQVGQQEMLLHAAMNRFGGLSKYHDLGYVMAPDPKHSSGVEVQLARFDRLYTQESYGKAGGGGTLFEYELVYPLTQTVGNDPQGLKIAQEGSGVQGLSVDAHLGSNKEDYRWHFLIKNQRSTDNYDPMIHMTQALSSSGASFASAIGETLDVDQWMRSFAIGSTYGPGDNWISNSRHNALFYHRPTDDKILFFLHDLDYNASVSASLKRNSILQKITAIDHWAHQFYGYVYDFVNTSFNRDYMAYWADHYARLLPEQNWSAWLGYIDSRQRSVTQQLAQALPVQIPFSVLTESASIDATSAASIQGRGWVNVNQIRLAETGTILDVTWTDPTHWQAEMTAEQGPGIYSLNAYNSQGVLLGSDTVQLTF